MTMMKTGQKRQLHHGANQIPLVIRSLVAAGADVNACTEDAGRR